LIDDRFKALKNTGRLPSPRGIYLEVARLVDAEETSSLDLARVLQADPALSARLLKMTSMAMRAGRRPIVSIPDAILVLGFAQIKRLVLALTLMQASEQRVPGFDYASFWTTSLLTALAVQELVQILGQAPADEIFVLGLLARIGHLSLASAYPEEFAQILQDAPTPVDELWLKAQELERFALDEDEVTGLLLEDWGFPAVYVEAAFFQSNAKAVPRGEWPRSLRIAHMLSLGRSLAQQCLLQTQDDDGQREHLLREAAHLGIDVATMETIAQSLLMAWPEWRGLLGEAAPLRRQVQLRQAADTEPGCGVGDAVHSLHVAWAGRVDAVPEVLLSLGKQGNAFWPLSIEGFLHWPGRDQVDLLVLDWDAIAELWERLLPRFNGRRELGPYLLLVAPELPPEVESRLFETAVDARELPPLTDQKLTPHLHAAARRRALRQEQAGRWQRLRQFAGTLVEVNRDLRQAALTDPLTALRNRRYVTERLAQEWAAAQRHGKTLAVLLLDLDNFKQINDELGHHSGDAVLRQLAATLQAHARMQDVLCRVGGDEFLVICPETTLDGARTMAERIRQALLELRVPGAESADGLSLSIGIATNGAEVDSPEALLQAADRALYRAKSHGRNRVEVYQGGTGGVGLG